MANVETKTDWGVLSGDLAQKQADLIAREAAVAAEDKASSNRTKVVITRMMSVPPTDFGGKLDWAKELQAFEDLDLPEYYLEPFHSVAGGWLSERAAEANRQAMQAIYADTHPESCMGIRKFLAEYVPADASTVVDLGTGDGDGAAAVARMLPKAQVLALDASPFMITAGRRQNPGLSNLNWKHGLAEATGLPTGSVDAVTLTLVLHECPDPAKAAILAEANRILRPGGTIVLSDTPQEDLLTYRGFYEPYKHEWVKFDAEKFLSTAGFENMQYKGTLGGDKQEVSEDKTHNRLFSWVATKPASSKL